MRPTASSTFVVIAATIQTLKKAFTQPPLKVLSAAIDVTIFFKLKYTDASLLKERFWKLTGQVYSYARSHLSNLLRSVVDGELCLSI